MKRLAMPLALVALTLLAYSNSFHGGFVLDNRGLLLNDPRLREASAENLKLIFQHTYWWPNGESGLYRPFTTLSYLMNALLFGNGKEPWGYHAVNFLLHAGNVLLAFTLAARLFRNTWTAFFCAALWAVHPVLTESVTNIVGRADLLAGGAVLAGLIAYLKGIEATGWRRFAWFAALAAVIGVGVFSKESAIVILGAIVLYELTFRDDRIWGRYHWLGLGAALIPCAVMLYVRHQVLSAAPPMEIPFTDNPIAWAGFLEGRLTALNVVARYFVLLAWPAHLSADYSWSQIPLAANWMVAAAVLAIVPATVLLYLWNRAAFFFFVLGLMWLAPASNLLFPIGSIMAERFLYLTALGFVACVVLAVDALARQTRTAKFVPILIGLLTAALAARTWVRNNDWKDNLTIASASVQTSPKSFKTHDLLANVLFASDPSHANIDRAIAESERSLAILAPLPDDRQPADPYRFAANCYMLRGAYQKAIPALQKLIAIEHANNLPQADAYLMLSEAYTNSADPTKAAETAAHASELNPLSPQVYLQMADTASLEGHLDDAAVALIEGAFITSDKSLRRALVDLYRTALDPKSCALTPGPNGPAINPACPIVHAHVCAASVFVVKTLAASQQNALAQTRKKMFLEQFGCPP